MAMSAHVRRLRAAMGTELLVLPSVTGIVFDDRNRILLVRQTESGLWGAPGGAVDPVEIPADAVVREVRVGRRGIYAETDQLPDKARLPEAVSAASSRR